MTSSPPARSPPSESAAPGAPAASGRASPARADSPEVLARVHEQLALVDVIAKQVRRELGGRIGIDDLLSFGREGLLTAARTFDPAVGVPFRRWANYRVRGAMLDGVRSMSMLPRSVYQRLRALEGALHTSEGIAEEASGGAASSSEAADDRLSKYLASIATAVAMGLLATSAGGTDGDGLDQKAPADELLARAETLETVKGAVAELPEQERHLIQRHYFDDVQLDEAAAELGLSKSWGSRLHLRAIESLTRQMKRSKTTL